MAAAANLTPSASFVPQVGAGTPVAGDPFLDPSIRDTTDLEGRRVTDLTEVAIPTARSSLPADLEIFLATEDSKGSTPINRQFFVDISKEDAEMFRDLYIQRIKLFNDLERLATTEGPFKALAEASLRAEKAFSANNQNGALLQACDAAAAALNDVHQPCHQDYINIDIAITKFFTKMTEKSASYDNGALRTVAKIWAHLEKEKGEEASKTAWREFSELLGHLDLSKLRIVTIAPPAPDLTAPTSSSPTPAVVASPSVAPTIERQGFDKAVTTPVVGSLAALVMLPVRTAQTVGYLALAIFQSLRNLFVKDISKEVEHKYGEKAIRAAKGMFVAVVAFIPLAGPPLAGLVLERWVDRRAAVKV